MTISHIVICNSWKTETLTNEKYLTVHTIRTDGYLWGGGGIVIYTNTIMGD